MHNNAWPPESLHSPRKWSFDEQEHLNLCPPGRCLISCRFLVLHSPAPLFCSREGLFTSTMQAVRTDSWMHSFWSCFPPTPPHFFSFFFRTWILPRQHWDCCFRSSDKLSVAPSISTQYVPVQFRYSIRVDRPGQEVSKPLVSPRSRAISRRPIFVESNKVKRAFFSMPIDVGRVGVVPVFFKLLPKNTFRGELFLQGERKDEKFVKFRRPKDAKCWLWHSKHEI